MAFNRRPAPVHTESTSTSWGDDEIASFFLTAVDAKSSEHQQQLAQGLARGVFALYGTSEFARAAGHLSQALELAQATGGDSLVALIQHHLGIALKEDGKHQWAETMQERALVTAQCAREARVHGRALKALGVLCMDAHDLSRALDYQQEALAIALTERDTELEARVFANLGNIAAAQLQFGHALSYHERDLRLSSLPHAPSRIGQLRAHRNLALVYARLGKRELEQQHEQLAARWAVGSRAFAHDLRTQPTSSVGNVYRTLDRRDAALDDVVTRSLREVLSELEPVDGDDDASDDPAVQTEPRLRQTRAAAVRGVQVKHVLITRASDRAEPSVRTTLSSSRSSARRSSGTERTT